jgi:hypothetical protein
MKMIRVGEALRIVDDAAWASIEHAMADGATVLDVGAAAMFIRAAGALRRKLDASSPAFDDIEAKYLTGLSLRLMEIDDGADLAGAVATATLISGKPVTQVGE